MVAPILPRVRYRRRGSRDHSSAGLHGSSATLASVATNGHPGRRSSSHIRRFIHDRLAERELIVAVLPNTRLKLSAPVLTEFSSHPELWCASIPFVNSQTLRRSLSAIR